jgi:hypothetical protein
MTTRSTARPGGVRLAERVEGLSDGLVTPVQAAVLNALRRSLAIALAMGETFSAQSGLAELKKANLEGRVPDAPARGIRRAAAGRGAGGAVHLCQCLAFLIAPHVGPGTVELGEVEEVLTDNAPLALQGALWELDQDIGALATDEAKLVAVVSAFAEALMKKVQIRAENGARVSVFTPGRGRSRRTG